jgi:NADPH-dependent curcumin reductase
MKNTQILLASRPDGWPTEANFRINEAPIPEPKDGEFLVRVQWLSLDPYMRGRMNDTKSYAAKAEIGEVMIGGAIGEVVTSKNATFHVGDFLVGSFGWQEYAVSRGAGTLKVDPKRVPLSHTSAPWGCLE